MTRQYDLMAACVVALLTALQLVSCDYKPQPKTFSDYVVRGEFLTRSGRFDEAIENYRKALEIDPESAIVYLRLGASAQAPRQAGSGQRELWQSIVACPKLASAYLEWGKSAPIGRSVG